MLGNHMANVAVERRAFPRRHLLVPAFVEHKNGDYFPCTTIDIAPNSARIEAKDVALPDRFILLLELSQNVRRHCRVVWRQGYVLGLQFIAWPAGVP
jgi:hypothetical protein